MKRTSLNPWTWSIELGFDQAELVEGGREVLYLAGQSAMGADGTPQHASDMAAQVTLALDNLEAVLGEAGMDLSNVVRLTTYTTDIDAMFASYGLVAERLGAAGVQPPGSLLGVSRLAFPSSWSSSKQPRCAEDRGSSMLGIDTGIDSSLYEATLVVHILLSIAGFGAVLLNGVYFAQAKKRLGPEGRAISEANFAASAIAEVLILAVPVSGLALVWVSGGAWSLDDLWVWVSLVLFVVAFAISRGVLRPAHRRVNRLLREARALRTPWPRTTARRTRGSADRRRWGGGCPGRSAMTT